MSKRKRKLNLANIAEAFGFAPSEESQSEGASLRRSNESRQQEKRRRPAGMGALFSGLFSGGALPSATDEADGQRLLTGAKGLREACPEINLTNRLLGINQISTIDGLTQQ